MPVMEKQSINPSTGPDLEARTNGTLSEKINKAVQIIKHAIFDQTAHGDDGLTPGVREFIDRLGK